MRIQVNLATRPFVELRPFFLRLRLFMGALAALGVALLLVAHLLGDRAARQQAELDQLRNQTIAAQQVKLHTESRMRQPGNAAVLDRAHFLNALFLRKSFSWTAVMMDLENVLPIGVQVTSIEPAVTSDGTVVIRLRVAGDRDRAVQLVRNLERSRRFLQPRLGSEAAQAKENGQANGQRPGTPSLVPNAPPGAPAGVEFEILANYNPLPPDESYKPEVYAPAHPRAAAELSPGQPAPAHMAAHPRAAGLNPNRNAQAGYPRNGVVLPPFGSSAAAANGGAR